MNNRSFFAIRHKPSGRFLPAINSYGFTRTEPSASDPPRLFVRKGSATQALDWWLEGESFEEVMENLDTPTPERHIRIRTLKRPNRRREDMEIVVVGLSYRTLEQAELDRL